MVDGEAQRVAEAVGDVAGDLVRAEDGAERGAAARELHGDSRHDQGDERADERREPAHALEPCPVERGLDQDRQHERGHEHDRLEARRGGHADSGHGKRLAGRGRPLERAGHCPGHEADHRVEGDLGHDEAGEREPRHGEREERRDEREARPDERARPEEDGHGRQGHDERLGALQQRVPELEVAEVQERTDEGRVDEAEERRRVTEDVEVAGRVEAPTELAVDHLVRGEPRRGHAKGPPEPHERRDADERRQREGSSGARPREAQAADSPGK